MNREDAKEKKRAIGSTVATTNEPNEELERLAREVIGSAIEVHRILGPGFLDTVYERARCREFELRNVPFEAPAPLPITYKGVPVGQGRLDLLVAKSLHVELKAVDCLAPIHTAPVMLYLRSAHLQLGLLIDFNVPVLRDGIKRIIASQ